MRPGDVFVSNDPYRGGSHLPDITVITPVFDGSTLAHPLFLHRQPGTPCRNRRNHARIDAAILQESRRRRRAHPGFQLIDGGRPRFDELRRRSSKPPPIRPAQSKTTLRICGEAANRRGIWI